MLVLSLEYEMLKESVQLHVAYKMLGNLTVGARLTYDNHRLILLKDEIYPENK